MTRARARPAGATLTFSMTARSGEISRSLRYVGHTDRPRTPHKATGRMMVFTIVVLPTPLWPSTAPDLRITVVTKDDIRRLIAAVADPPKMHCSCKLLMSVELPGNLVAGPFGAEGLA